MDTYKCEYCNNVFKSMRTIKYHQKTAKFCLVKQKKQIICECCGTLSFSRNDFENHQNNCISFLKNEIKVLEEKIKDLQDENKDIVYYQNKIEFREKQFDDKDNQINYKNNEIDKLKEDMFNIHVKNEIYEKECQNKTKEPFITSDIIKNFKLILEDNSTINIPVRNDGYINVTTLCKASNRRIDKWKETKESKELLQAFNVIPQNRGITPLVALKGNSSEINQGTFAHPDIAIQIAQWCSSKFAIQVSQWIRELLVVGKVEFGNEKTNKELDYISEQKRLSLDIQPYLFKDVLYFFEFKPDAEFLHDKSTLENENIHYFEFGVTSNIQQRQSSYGSGYRLDKVFVYDSGFKSSLAESHVKKLVLDMNLKLNYKNKFECMKCTYEELENMYTEMLDHNFTSKEEPQKNEDFINTSDSFELQKLKIQAETDKIIHKRENLMTMLKQGLLTFEQFKICFEVC